MTVKYNAVDSVKFCHQQYNLMKCVDEKNAKYKWCIVEE